MKIEEVKFSGNFPSCFCATFDEGYITKNGSYIKLRGEIFGDPNQTVKKIIGTILWEVGHEPSSDLLFSFYSVTYIAFFENGHIKVGGTDAMSCKEVDELFPFLDFVEVGKITYGDNAILELIEKFREQLHTIESLDFQELTFDSETIE